METRPFVVALTLGVLVLAGCAQPAAKGPAQEPSRQTAAANKSALLGAPEAQAFPNELLSVPYTDLDAELSRRAAGIKNTAEFVRFSDLEVFKALDFQVKAIYGRDDRREVQDIPDPVTKQRSESVVALFKASDVHDNGNGTSTLQTANFAAAYRLCATERFGEQPIGAYCSGFLVAPDIIATAGHCVGVPGSAPQDTRFVFGFRLSGAAATTTISNAEIYKGAALLGRDQNNTGADWALVRLDRPVAGHPPLPFRKAGRIAPTAPVYVIGHPCGLPAKHAGNANVRDNAADAFFVANLDTYGGNSGSPVFAADNTVEGILVRGETDFVNVNGCNLSKTCPNTGCRGEDCTRTTVFSALIP